MILVAIIFAFVTGFLGSYIATQKGRSGTEGFFIGFLFSLLGVIIVALLPNKFKKPIDPILHKQTDPKNEETDLKQESKKIEKTAFLSANEKSQLKQKESKRDRSDLFLLFGFIVISIVVILYISENSTENKVSESTKKETISNKEDLIEKKTKSKPRENINTTVKKSNYTIEKQLISELKLFNRLKINKDDVVWIVNSFLRESKGEIKSKKINNVEQLEISYERNDFGDNYFRIIIKFKGEQIFKSAPFVAQLTKIELERIEKKVSINKKSYKDLVKEIVTYDDVINSIEIDLAKSNINPEKITRVEIQKSEEYSLEITFYQKDKILGTLKSVVPASWIKDLKMFYIYKASLD